MEVNHKKFVYIHIPKTAGRFIKDTFKRSFKEEILSDISFKKEPKMFRKEMGKEMIANRFVFCGKLIPRNFHEGIKIKNVVFGHFQEGKYQFLGWPFVTFLRNPIDRIVSEYSNLRGENDKYKNLTLVEFSKEQANLITWMIDDIDKFLFVGFVEKLEESLDRLEHLLDRKLVRLTPKNWRKYKNTVYPKYILSKEEKDQIESYNRLDMDLYDQEYKKFREALQI